MVRKIPDGLPNGEVGVSGKKLRQLWNEPQIQAMARKFFPTRQQQQRIATIIRTAVRLEGGMAAKPASEGITGDVPGQLVELIGRIGGAQIGRVIAARTGGGTVQTPGIVSGKVRELLRKGVQDPARRLLIDAINDEKLFRSLLVDASKPEGARFVTRQLNAWAAVLTGDVIADTAIKARGRFAAPVGLSLGLR